MQAPGSGRLLTQLSLKVVSAVPWASSARFRHEDAAPTGPPDPGQGLPQCPQEGPGAPLVMASSHSPLNQEG